MLNGKMKLSTAPVTLIYLEGPPTGVDILVSYFSITPSNPEPVSLLISSKCARCSRERLVLTPQKLQSRTANAKGC